MLSTVLSQGVRLALPAVVAGGPAAIVPVALMCVVGYVLIHREIDVHIR